MRRNAFLAGSAAALVPAAARAQYTINPLNPSITLLQATIAVSVPLSGPYADFGHDVVRGVQAAIDETNRYNAMTLNRAYGIRALDDQNSGAIATTNVAIAAADQSVVAMIGNLTSDVTIQALSQYANSNFAVIVPTVTADTLTMRGYHNVFRLPTKDSSEGSLFARAVLPRKSLSVLAINVDGDYGADVARGFADQARADKHQSDQVTLPNGFDPGEQAEAIVKRTPDYIFLAGRVDRLGPFGEALRTAGYTGEFGASDGFYTQTTIDKYAKLLDGAYVATPFPPLNRIPSILQIYNDFQREVGSISAFSAYGYAAAQIIIAAVQRSSQTNRFSTLTTMQTPNAVFDTIVGNYTFNFTGDATIPNIYLYTVHADGFKYDMPAIRDGFVV